MSDPCSPVAKIQRVATPLGGTDPESRLHTDAADVLRDEVKDVSIVALGETSHGARAQFRLKHRLIRFLVEEMDVRAFAIEEDINWVQEVDTYVTDGEADIKEVLRSARINWPWKTTELVGLFDWMRTFNEDRPEDDRVRIYGFDTSSFGRVAATLSTFFDAVDADVPAVRAELETLADQDEDAAVDAAASLIDTLPALFDDHTEWGRHCPSPALALARRQSVLLAQALKLREADVEDAFAVRDAAMAANAQWIVGDGGAEQAVLWAHNLHVARAEQSDAMTDVPGRTMGDCLAARHGDDYVPIGFGLGGGEYLAMNAKTMEPATPSVPEPPTGSIPDAFLGLDVVTPFVSTATLREREGIANWLAAGPRRHRISGMIEDGESLTYVASDLSEFDGFAFVEATDPTRHLGLDGPDASRDG